MELKDPTYIPELDKTIYQVENSPISKQKSPKNFHQGIQNMIDIIDGVLKDIKNENETEKRRDNQG